MKVLLVLVLLLTQTLSLSIAEVLVDPTKPTTALGATSSTNPTFNSSDSKLVLNAIMLSPHSKQAVINGKFYVVGQAISGFQVHSIGKNQVVLTGAGGNKTLYVNNSNIKKDVHNGF